MEKEFVSYEVAVKLQELGCGVIMNYKYWRIEKNILVFHDNYNMQSIIDKGFDVECLNVYAPLKQQVFRWFREKYDLPNHIDTYWQHDWNDYSYQWSITENHEAWTSMEHYKAYEEAENACIYKLIELAKQQDK